MTCGTPAFVLLTAGCALVCTACADQTVAPTNAPRAAAIEQAVVGGQAVTPGGWPNVLGLDSGCTATLLAPDVLVTAAHCTPARLAYAGEYIEGFADAGAADDGQVSRSPARELALRECIVHPHAEIGGGEDLALCFLDAPLHDVPIVAPAVGCARAAIEVGDELTLVGFGLQAPHDTVAGYKRVVRTAFLQSGRELVAGDDERGSCPGDSGGPAFARVTQGEAGPAHWQLLGVLSSGAQDECGVGYYIELARHMDWLERESQRDFTPCSDAYGQWQPGPACRAAGLDAEGGPDERDRDALSTCGPPFELEAARPAARGCSAAGGRSRAMGPVGAAWHGLAVLLWLRGRRRSVRRGLGCPGAGARACSGR